MTTKEDPVRASDRLQLPLTLLESLISGTAFGAVLTATGMFQPSVIRAQMMLENWHMAQTFLMASGSSTAVSLTHRPSLVITLCQKLGYTNFKSRSFSTLGVLGALDGNIIGGTLLGIGMTLSGACPGTLFAQLGTGVPASLYTLAGAILGSVVWSGFLQAPVDALKAVAQTPTEPEDLRLDALLGTGPVVTALGVASMFGGAVAAIGALGLAQRTGLVGPVLGGLLIAGAQLFSVIVRRALLGTSASFEELGHCVAWALRGREENCKPQSYSSMVLVTGIMMGAMALSFATPLPVVPDAEISTTSLVLGGMLLVVGSRLGGGCTSGHGISGISLLSVSSFVTVAAMFAGAMGAALFI